MPPSRAIRAFAAAGLVTTVVLGGAFIARDPLATWLAGRGALQQRRWELRDAITSYTWALRLSPTRSEVRLSRAECFVLSGDVREALRDVDRLLAEPVLDPRRRALALVLAGESHFGAKRAEAAREALQEGLALASTDPPLRAHALIVTARVLYHLQGRSDEALGLLEEALDVARREKDPLLAADAMRHIGVVRWWFRGEVDSVLVDWYLPALELYRRHGDLRGEARTVSNIGLLHGFRGDLAAFLEREKEAGSLSARINDGVGLADHQAHLGNMYRNAGSLGKARAHYAESLRICDELGYRLTQDEVEFMLAGVHFDLREYERALLLLARLHEAERANPVLAKYRLATMAECQLALGRPADAARSCRQALDLECRLGQSDHRFALFAHTLLAEASMALGSPSEAVDALAFAEREAAGAEVVHPWGIRHNVARAELAARYGSAAEVIDRLAGAADVEADLLDNRAGGFMPDRHDALTDRILSLLVGSERSREPEALTLLFRFLEHQRVRTFRSWPSRARSPERVVTLDEVQRRLHPGTLVLVFFPVQEQLFALAIRTHVTMLVPLRVTVPALAAKVKLLRAEIGSGRGEDAPIAFDLYRLLFGPVDAAGLLVRADRIATMTFGPLHDLPLPALLRLEKPARRLVEDFVLVRVPSGASLIPGTLDEPASVPVLAFGAREAGEPGLGPLPHAEEEARAVAAILHGQAVLGSAATEAAFFDLGPRARRIHLAVHGIPDPDIPALSRLALVPAGDLDGRLTALEISERPLAAELVTLSACDSALSHSEGGREAGEADRLGLVEAFLHAGARSVAASLAPLHDRATSELMGSFYAALASGNDPATALAVAQRSRVARPPREWATFVIVGQDARWDLLAAAGRDTAASSTRRPFASLGYHSPLPGPYLPFPGGYGVNPSAERVGW